MNHLLIILAALGAIVASTAGPPPRVPELVGNVTIRVGWAVDDLVELGARVLMAVGISNAQANSVLDAIARGTDFAGNAAVYVKLHTGDPGAAGTANAAGNTTRQQASFAAAAAGANATNADILWTNVNTAETYSHVSFWTAAAAGTFLGSSALTASKLVAIGDDFVIKSGTLTMALTPVAA